MVELGVRLGLDVQVELGVWLGQELRPIQIQVLVLGECSRAYVGIR